MNPLQQLLQFGQSFWYDNIRRELLTSGELARMVREDGLRGMTSNPTIFAKAVSSGGDYDATIRAWQTRAADEIFLELELEDIAGAADVLRPIYDQSGGKDGYVSIEVFPNLARDAAATIDQARLLWRRLLRPNVMVKVPSTPECIPAIATLLEEGININITLMFGFDSYQHVVEAYMGALEHRLAAGKPIAHIGSVASLFVSRVDSKVDAKLEALAAANPAHAAEFRALEGRAGIANAQRMYRHFQECFAGPRWQRLAAQGAQPQRLLWASTSTKNPKYPDTLYAEALVGPETVDTMPDVTVEAFRDHGKPADRLSKSEGEFAPVLEGLKREGIDFDAVLLELQNEGVELFEKSYQELIASIEKKVQALRAETNRPALLSTRVEAPAALTQAAAVALGELGSRHATEALWRHEAQFWSSDAAAEAAIGLRLGWLHVVETMCAAQARIQTFAADCRKAGLRAAVLLGMGGSSLAPAVFASVFGAQDGGMPVHVLDTTDPDAITHLESRLDLTRTLFLVSSKSGGTLEPNCLFAYFWSKVQAALPSGADVGSRFVAVTDPGTSLEALAYSHHFREVFLNPADIGGRYSALSFFGLVPAALLGVDVGALLARAETMAAACRQPAEQNPGVQLGAALGAWAKFGRDKLTFLTSQSLANVGLWLEQLIAESTGKHGTGIIPLAGEPAAPAGYYGNDRVFVHLALRGEDSMDAHLDALARAHPVVRIVLAEKLDLGQVFFQWEFATAVAGAVLGINPFDEPNVQESKDNTNRVLASLRQSGGSLDGPARAEADGLGFYSEVGPTDAEALLRGWLESLQAGDYAALMAYLEPTNAIANALEHLRVTLRDRLHVATTVGFGPRFLHSTGQLHKGGPATGVFLQLTARPTSDAAIPGRAYTFGTLFAAQAAGDYQSLARHGRRLLRVDLGGDAEAGLAELQRRLDIELARMQPPAAAGNGQRAAD